MSKDNEKSLEEYVDYLAKNLDDALEKIAELEKITSNADKYSEYLAENLDDIISMVKLIEPEVYEHYYGDKRAYKDSRNYEFVRKLRENGLFTEFREMLLDKGEAAAYLEYDKKLTVISRSNKIDSLLGNDDSDI